MNHNKIFKIFCGLALTCACTSVFADLANKPVITPNKTNFHFETLFLQPGSNNLKYAVFVSGNQPLYQSWHNQIITPGYSPAFELGFNYGLPQSEYGLSVDWLYLNSNDSNSKQASQNTNVSTVEFVAPPYDVGPAVFGIKRADSKVNYNFNDILLNINKVIQSSSDLQIKIFGGLNILRLNQTLTTTFSDYAGSPPISGQAYGLPADPSFYFQTQNKSTYLGAGPDIGVDIKYEIKNGFGVLGKVLGTITAGSMSASDNFTSASARLKALGINTSSQSITTPSSTSVVPGFDSNVGLFYSHSLKNNFNFTIEVGYRLAYYLNAISTIYPGTLVQAGSDATIPEFATGTMAINSTESNYSPFSLNGPYLNLTFDIF